MTKYLETKKNSIEEAISSVVLDEKFSITLPPVRGGKKLLNIDMGRAIRMLKDFGATKSDIRNVLSGRGGRFQNANGEMFLVQRESVELGEAKYEVQYTVSSRVGDSRSRTKSRLSKIDIDARSKEDAEKKFFKQAEKSPMMKDAMRRDMLDVVYVGLKESLDEQEKSSTIGGGRYKKPSYKELVKKPFKSPFDDFSMLSKVGGVKFMWKYVNIMPSGMRVASTKKTKDIVICNTTMGTATINKPL